MTETAEKQAPRPGPSELLCKVCGTVEMIRMEWQRCYPCYMNCETRHHRTYPSFCVSCCKRLHQ